MGGGRSGRLCGAAGSSGAACTGQRLLFPAAQSLGQRGALCSGPLRSPCGRRRAGLLPQSRRLRHLGCGCRLFLLDIIEPELCIRLGLRQLPAQAVRRRSRLCPECRRGPRIHLRLHGRRLHQFHHPLYRVPVLPHEPHRRRLFLQSGVLHPAHPAGAAGRPRRQGRADPECEEPDVLFPLRHDAHGGLSLPADERGAGPAGLVRTHLRVCDSSTDAGSPIRQAGAGAVRPHLPGHCRHHPRPPVVPLLCGGLLLRLRAAAHRGLCAVGEGRRKKRRPCSNQKPRPLWPCVRRGDGHPALADGVPHPRLQLRRPLLLL